MFPVNFSRLMQATCAAVLITCSTGCMIEPGHGQYYGSRDSLIRFMGATLSPSSRVEIQAYHPTRGWERLAEATAEMPYSDHNGDWYVWFVRQQIPEEYWTPLIWNYRARVRAVNLADGEPLYSFDKSFPLDSFLAPIGPEYMTMNVAEMWYRWGHGTEINIYADYLSMRAPLD